MKVKVKSLSRVRLFATPWTVAHQAPPSMEFSRQEYWSGLPFPSPGDLPNLGIEPWSPTLQADSLPAEPQGKCKNTGVGSLLLSPGDLPIPGIELGSPALQVDSGKPKKGPVRSGINKIVINNCNNINIISHYLKVQACLIAHIFIMLL